MPSIIFDRFFLEARTTTKFLAVVVAAYYLSYVVYCSSSLSTIGITLLLYCFATDSFLFLAGYIFIWDSSSNFNVQVGVFSHWCSMICRGWFEGSMNKTCPWAAKPLQRGHVAVALVWLLEDFFDCADLAHEIQIVYLQSEHRRAKLK